jgi:hypothetical protein
LAIKANPLFEFNFNYKHFPIKHKFSELKKERRNPSYARSNCLKRHDFLPKPNREQD